MVKVLHLIETGGPGGAETVLLNLVKNLDSSRFRSVVGILRKGWLYDELRKTEAETVVLKSSASCDVSLLLAIIKAARGKTINLMHSHLPDMNFYSCLAGKLIRVPVLATYHGMVDMKKSLKGLLKYFTVGTTATKIVSVSNYLNEELSGLVGFGPHKIVTIYNGIDFDESDPFSNKADVEKKKRELGLGDAEFLVGMVANLRKAKGYEYFIRSAAIVKHSCPSVKFIVIGEEDKEIKRRLNEEIAELDLSHQVHFLGFRKDVATILKMLDVFALSSVSEGFSLVTVEAMACGRPVVATEAGALKEIVTDGKTGFLVPPRDDRALAERIILLLKDKALAKRVGDAASREVKAKFHLAGMIRKYEDLYCECLKHSRWHS